MDLLKEEFEDDDLLAKKRATERIYLVAKSLKPEGTRNELIRWLTERIESKTESDEILYMFATQINDFVPFVGGKEYANVLSLFIEKLCGVDETVVRKQTVESTKQLISTLPTDQIEQSFVPLLTTLANSDWFTSKVSAAQLISTVLSSFAQEPKKYATVISTIKPIYTALCKDDMPLVRRAAAQELGEVAKVWPSSQDIVQELVPLYFSLAEDANNNVRLCAVDQTACLCTTLNSKELENSGMVSRVLDLMQDSSWQVRRSIASSIASISSSFGKTQTETVMLPRFVMALQDTEAEVREACAKQILSLLKCVSKEVAKNMLLPAIGELIALDPNLMVRKTLAEVIVTESFVEMIGPKSIQSDLLPLWEQLLKSEFNGSHETRLSVLRGLKTIIKSVGASTIMNKEYGWRGLLEKIFDSSKSSISSSALNQNDEIVHPQWRLRKEILNSLECLVGGETSQSETIQFVLDFWFRGLNDEVYEVRMTSANLLNTFCKESSSIGIEEVVKSFIPKLLEFHSNATGLSDGNEKGGKTNNYLHRITFLHAAFCLVVYPEAWNLVSSCFHTSLNDKVANVKIAACMMISEMSDASVKQEFIPKLEMLLKDQDQDVVEAAMQSLA